MIAEKRDPSFFGSCFDDDEFISNSILRLRYCVRIAFHFVTNCESSFLHPTLHRTCCAGWWAYQMPSWSLSSYDGGRERIGKSPRIRAPVINLHNTTEGPFVHVVSFHSIRFDLLLRKKRVGNLSFATIAMTAITAYLDSRDCRYRCRRSFRHTTRPFGDRDHRTVHLKPMLCSRAYRTTRCFMLSVMPVVSDATSGSALSPSFLFSTHNDDGSGSCADHRARATFPSSSSAVLEACS
mmetsp:Transcript_5662/g.16769  ORF Transcript_5662/g.16769 Transcript_5662/m.16769 type:complete len:238 (+) Transcript_5662:76-789(+)